MFKSMFLKYIMAFLIIITLSFTIVAFIISASIVNYSIVAKQNSMYNASMAAKRHIEQSYRKTLFSFDAYMEAVALTLPDDLAPFTAIADDCFIFVTDMEGRVLVSTPNTSIQAGATVPTDLMRYIAEKKDISRFQTLNGFFERRHMVYPDLVEDLLGNGLCAVFTCSASATTGEFVETIINTIILSCLSVLIAAMVIIYFITEKIVSPINAMAKATKAFAGGHFDVRVPVRGGDEVAELAIAFNNMAYDLSKKEELDRTFLANVSHDLRTPMTSIAGFIDGILDGTIPAEKHDYYLGIVTTEIRRLSRLVSSMLDVTRIQSGEQRFNKTAFNISELAMIVLLSFEQKIESKKITVSFDCDNTGLMVFADSDAIHQILYNLCDNAIKFTNEGGELRISIREQEKKIITSVYNSGEGIKSDELRYIFDRFYKSDASRGLDKTGVGLGLFIVKKIIEAHKETITVNSEYGKFCEFTFTLQKS